MQILNTVRLRKNPRFSYVPVNANTERPYQASDTEKRYQFDQIWLCFTVGRENPDWDQNSRRFRRNFLISVTINSLVLT